MSLYKLRNKEIQDHQAVFFTIAIRVYVSSGRLISVKRHKIILDDFSRLVTIGIHYYSGLDKGWSSTHIRTVFQI